MLPFHCASCDATNEEHAHVTDVTMDAETRRGREQKKGGNGERGGKHLKFFFFFTYVFLVHADHDSWMFWASNNGRENGSGSIITGETGLAHTGTVVDHEGLDFFIVIAHIVLVFWFVGVF